jgi:membrane-associated phospholipid phosphatase
MMQIWLYSGDLAIMALCFHVAFLIGYAIRWLVHLDRARPLSQQLPFSGMRPYLRLRRVLGVLSVLVLLPPFMGAFTSIKQAIPKIAPFTWDRTLMEWDHSLHGGHHPWQLLNSLLAWPLVSSLITYLYAFWMFIMFGLLFWQAWSEERLLRMRFFLSYVLLWILAGSILAILLSSAGPCFYGWATSLPDPFEPLMLYLRNAHDSYPVLSLEAQAMLKEAYNSGKAESYVGISAMPSMHVAMATLFALVGWQASRWLGMGLTLFAVTIQIGSVHLGWHYAIDGYVGAILAVLIWQIVGWGLRRSHWIARVGST